MYVAYVSFTRANLIRKSACAKEHRGSIKMHYSTKEYHFGVKIKLPTLIFATLTIKNLITSFFTLKSKSIYLK